MDDVNAKKLELVTQLNEVLVRFFRANRYFTPYEKLVGWSTLQISRCVAHDDGYLPLTNSLAEEFRSFFLFKILQAKAKRQGKIFVFREHPVLNHGSEYKAIYLVDMYFFEATKTIHRILSHNYKQWGWSGFPIWDFHCLICRDSESLSRAEFILTVDEWEVLKDDFRWKILVNSLKREGFSFQHFALAGSENGRTLLFFKKNRKDG